MNGGVCAHEIERSREVAVGEWADMDLTELVMPIELFRPADAVRSPGVHISDIIRDIDNTVIHPGQRKKFEELTEDEKRRMGGHVLGGYAWEEIVKEALVRMTLARDDRYTKLGEVEKDGIICTCDLFDTEDWLPEEFKATWKSSRRPIDEDFWTWWTQIKAYCYALGSSCGRLRVFFVNGDYKGSGPRVRAWHADFTDEELESNWEMLRSHAQEKGWI